MGAVNTFENIQQAIIFRWPGRIEDRVREIPLHRLRRDRRVGKMRRLPSPSRSRSENEDLKKKKWPSITKN